MGSWASSLHLSSDGRTLAYVNSTGSEAGLFTLSTSGGDPRLLLRLPAEIVAANGRLYDITEVVSARWSPDGSILAYHYDNHPGGLYVISGQGGTPKKLAEMPAWGGSARWSPDGKYVAAMGYPEGEQKRQRLPLIDQEPAVFVVPASGGELRWLTAPDESGYKEGLVWHPDGQRLTYVHYLSAGGSDSELREAYPDGRPSSLLFNQPDHWDSSGTWAPDGKHFYFAVLAPGYEVLKYEAETGAFTPVMTTNLGSWSWSRDGKTVVWQVARRTSELWLMENFR